MGGVERSEDCISIYDKDLNILYWNTSCETQFSISKSNAIGTNLLILFPAVKNDYRVDCLQQAITLEKSFFFSNMPYSTRAGLYHQVIMPIRSPLGIPTQVLNIVRDARVEENFITKEDLLNPIQRTRSAFIKRFRS